MDSLNSATIRAVSQAFEEGRLKDFLAHCTADIRWTLIGTGTWSGADAVRGAWARMMGCNGGELPHICIDQIFADEADGIADGTVITRQADGFEHVLHYCSVYRFRDGKIAELKSYCIGQQLPPDVPRTPGAYSAFL